MFLVNFCIYPFSVFSCLEITDFGYTTFGGTDFMLARALAREGIGYPCSDPDSMTPDPWIPGNHGIQGLGVMAKPGKTSEIEADSLHIWPYTE